MAEKVLPNKYRDILVNQIKDIGQEIIDRAEEMVSEKASYLTGFSIYVNIPQPSEECPTISWTTETINTTMLKNMDEKK